MAFGLLQSICQTMKKLALRELRHNLRTPINHVLGFTEILIEDARDAGREAVLGDLERIHDSARQALARVNEATADGGDMPALAAQLRPTVEGILACTERVGQVAPEWSKDLARIRSGAEALLSLAANPDSAPSPPSIANQAPPEPRLSQGRLLVVDDNEPNRHMLRRLLEGQGYAIGEAEDGHKALDRLRSERFDLVLLDIMMPGMDGFQVLAELKRDNALRGIPVVVVSAVDEIESVVRSIEMGAEDYLLKPFDPVLLRARVGASIEKQRLRNELLMKERLASLGVLAAGIAHEIRNPLNFVTNFADLSVELVRELRDNLDRPDLLELTDDLEQNARKIKEHGSRANSIVESILRHGRTSSGERRPTDLNALVAEAVSLAYHGLRAQDVTFNATVEAAYDPTVGMVNVVPGDISRVVLNIAGNAFYAVRHASRPLVQVETVCRGKAVEIRIRDNGPGIPDEIRPRVFEPFFTTKPVGEGTGLGLSLSYDMVVNGHKGEIRVESAPQQGAEFVVVLPKEAA